MKKSEVFNTLVSGKNRYREMFADVKIPAETYIFDDAVEKLRGMLKKLVWG